MRWEKECYTEKDRRRKEKKRRKKNMKEGDRKLTEEESLHPS